MTNYLVVTGGSRGIGKAIASHFYAQNWKVVNLSRGPCDLPDVIDMSHDLKRRIGKSMFLLS